jgi:hypothetical protein
MGWHTVGAYPKDNSIEFLEIFQPTVEFRYFGTSNRGKIQRVKEQYDIFSLEAFK